MTKLLKRQPFDVVNAHLIEYPTPINFNNLYNYGGLAAICLGVQILTGVFLAMHYTPHVDYAFLSVEHIMRDVNNGWFFRYVHANGASMMFIALYIHMFKHLYYGSYMRPRHLLWVSGVVIFLLTVAIGFLGYVLPWGQMSFWGATVITNLFSAIPVLGKLIVNFLWGGFAVDNPCLNRLFSLHYLLPFVIAGLSILHLVLLHTDGNNNPLGISSKFHFIYFYPYFYVKDLFGFICLMVLFTFFLYFYPKFVR
jgi:ubiquinol-cytochrome c reductase cytochrome b subunit